MADNSIKALIIIALVVFTLSIIGSLLVDPPPTKEHPYFKESTCVTYNKDLLEEWEQGTALLVGKIEKVGKKKYLISSWLGSLFVGTEGQNIVEVDTNSVEVSCTNGK